MCRLLTIRDTAGFDLGDYLNDFAQRCRHSPEYQGHGWGMSWRRDGIWNHHRSVTPIWDDAPGRAGWCDFLMVHARSAFRDEGIVVENNMPFHDEHTIFTFNGELHGVKLKAEGRIGAEKIFNYIKRFDQGDLAAALDRGVDVIRKRTRHVRGMNILMARGNHIHLATSHEADHDYYTLHYQTGPRTMVCSEPMFNGLEPIPNHTTLTL